MKLPRSQTQAAWARVDRTRTSADRLESLLKLEEGDDGAKQFFVVRELRILWRHAFVAWIRFKHPRIMAVVDRFSNINDWWGEE